MSKKSAPRKHSPPPRPRATAKAPAQRATGAVPQRVPAAPPPTPHVGRAPKQHSVGKVPNPRKPKLVRDVAGGILKDLFAFFPDLPRPRRPGVRRRVRTGRTTPRRR